MNMQQIQNPVKKVQRTTGSLWLWLGLGILLFVAAVVVSLAIQFTSVAVYPAAGPIDYTPASKYEDRYDRMNHSLSADPSYIPGNYEDRYDRMNHFLLADPSYISGKHEDRYDFMNDFPGTDR